MATASRLNRASGRSSGAPGRSVPITLPRLCHTDIPKIAAVIIRVIMAFLGVATRAITRNQRERASRFSIASPRNPS